MRIFQFFNFFAVKNHSMSIVRDLAEFEQLEVISMRQSKRFDQVLQGWPDGDPGASAAWRSRESWS